VAVVGQVITFTILEGLDNDFTYDVIAPGVAGVYSPAITGIVRDIDQIECPVTGDEDVTVIETGLAVELWVDTGYREVGPGADATYTIEVRNLGSLDDTYDLAVTTDADSAALTVPAVFVVSGGTALVDLDVSDSTAGFYVSMVEAVSQANPAVSDELSVVTRVTGVPPTYAVSVTAMPPERTVGPDADATYTIDIQNTGTTADSYNLTIPLNQADFGGLSLGLVGPLAPSASTSVTLTVRDSTVGDYLTTVRATSVASPAVSDDDTVTTHVVIAGNVFFPSSVDVTLGTITSGSAADLANGGTLNIASGPFMSEATIWTGIIEITDPGTVTGLTVTYTGHYSATVTQRLAVYDFTLGAFKLVNTRLVGTTDDTATWTAVIPAKYISGTGEVWVMVNSVAASAFTCIGDLMQVEVTR
jgi:hypothetical protein